MIISIFNITSVYGTGLIGSLVTVAQYVCGTGGWLMEGGLFILQKRREQLFSEAVKEN
jgi:hypothetical protein